MDRRAGESVKFNLGGVWKLLSELYTVVAAAAAAAKRLFKKHGFTCPAQNLTFWGHVRGILVEGI